MYETTLPQLLAGISAFSDRLSGAIVMTPRAPARKPKGWAVVAYEPEPVTEAA